MVLNMTMKVHKIAEADRLPFYVLFYLEGVFMKLLYLDLGMGAAGDMLMASLLELFDDREAVVRELNSIGIEGVEYSSETVKKCGITGTHMHVLVDGEEESPDGEHHHDHGHDHEHEHHHDHDHEHEHHHDHDHEHEHHHNHEHDHEHAHSHHHAHLSDIENLIDHLNISESVREKAKGVYALIAEAESVAHDTDINNIHFHEVGTKDAVADVVAVCYLMEKIGADKVMASPVHVGRGTVRCAHGILPVPAPATAYILKGIPVYSREIVEGELCTPTGAALLKTFVDEFASMPVMEIQKIGYGMGTKDFPICNAVRTMLGDTEDIGDTIVELDCNIDDMTGEEIGFAVEKILESGVRDVFQTPIYMKKNRPGVLISVLCTEDDKKRIVETMFRYTSTLGIRESVKNRYILQRETKVFGSVHGDVRIKRSKGYGSEKDKFEYDDMAQIAEKEDSSISVIRYQLMKEMGSNEE